MEDSAGAKTHALDKTAAKHIWVMEKKMPARVLNSVTILAQAP